MLRIALGVVVVATARLTGRTTVGTTAVRGEAIAHGTAHVSVIASHVALIVHATKNAEMRKAASNVAMREAIMSVVAMHRMTDRTVVTPSKTIAVSVARKTIMSVNVMPKTIGKNVGRRVTTSAAAMRGQLNAVMIDGRIAVTAVRPIVMGAKISAVLTAETTVKLTAMVAKTNAVPIEAAAGMPIVMVAGISGAIAPVATHIQKFGMVDAITATGTVRVVGMGIGVQAIQSSTITKAMTPLVGPMRALGGTYIPALMCGIVMWSLKRFIGAVVATKKSRCCVMTTGVMAISNQAAAGFIAIIEPSHRFKREGHRLRCPSF
jgi:hypothetical protein